MNFKNKDEQFVYDYYSENFDYEIEYLGNRNSPPDLVLNSNIGVEIRRLNQHVENNGDFIPLENLSFSIIQGMNRVVNELRNLELDDTYFLSFQYKRPQVVNSKLFKTIRKTVKENIPIANTEVIHFSVENINIEIKKASERGASSFFIGSAYDYDSGGFIVHEIYKNLELVIKEKEDKISDIIDNYKEWWLLLVDYIGRNIIDENDVEQLKDAFNGESIFDKIIILSKSGNTTHLIELK